MMVWLQRYWGIPLLLALQLLFWQVPALDLWFSGLFWRPGEGFYLADLAPVQWSYWAFRYIPYLLVPVLVWLFVASWIWARRSEAILRRGLLFLFLVMAIGPGLLVNEVFKAESGRARPATVQQFEGSRVFTPAFEGSDQCSSNCSFVSGHAAMGFFFLAFAWVLRDRRWLYWGAAIGLLVGLGRVMQGAHFLSDVLFGYPVVYLTALLLARPLLGRWRID
jgi:lipid A 4'-phosphatase